MNRLEALVSLRLLIEQYGDRLRFLPKERYGVTGDLLSAAGISIMSCTLAKVDREIERLKAGPP